jgi:HEAT repeat protein
MFRAICSHVVVALLGVGLGAGGFWAVQKYRHPPLGNSKELAADPDEPFGEVPWLLACFQKDDWDLRLQAEESLKKMGPKVVDPLRAKLKNKNPQVRFCAVETLGWIGSDAAPAAPEIIVCLADSDPNVRFKSAYSLGRLGVTTDPVIEGLTKALSDSDTTVADTAKESLQQIGAPAAPKLYQMLKSSKDSTRERILSALEKMGPPPADSVAELAVLAKDTNAAVSNPALMLLGQAGEPAIPTFKELLKGAPLKEPTLVQAVAKLGPNAKQLIPELKAALAKKTDRSFEIDNEVFGIFKKCGSDGATAMAGLLKSGSLTNPHASLVALGEMGSDAKDAVPVLIAMLKDRPELRLQILQTFGDIGPAAREAVPAVRELTKDPGTGEHAQIALRRMGVIEKK